MLECPSSSWIVRRSAPPSSRWVAKEWRSVCGETPARRRLEPEPPPDVRGGQPLARSSTGTAPRSRRVQDRPAAREVAVERPPGVLADGHHPGATALSLHAHLLGVGVEAPPRRGSRAPPRAARRRRRARAARGRAGRAGSSPGCARGARPPRPASAPSAGRRPSWGSRRARRGSPPARRARRGAGRRSGSRRACARPSTSSRRAPRPRRRSGAARGGSSACGAELARRAPTRASWPRSTP